MVAEAIAYPRPRLGLGKHRKREATEEGTTCGLPQTGKERSGVATDDGGSGDGGLPSGAGASTTGGEGARETPRGRTNWRARRDAV